jgi:hypothetical protein
MRKLVAACATRAGSSASTPGCIKNTQSRGLCIRHGGGRGCEVEGCPRGAQARGKCKTHGGGVRCKAPDCWRSSQGSGLCRAHGGGKLYEYPGCTKGTQRHSKCSTHGGVRRCQVDGCEKVDRGVGLCARHKKEANASVVSASTTLLYPRDPTQQTTRSQITSETIQHDSTQHYKLAIDCAVSTITLVGKHHGLHSVWLRLARLHVPVWAGTQTHRAQQLFRHHDNQLPCLSSRPLAGCV